MRKRKRNFPEGNRHPWDSRREQSETHPIKGVNGMWFKNKGDAESFRAHRNLKARARTAGFPTTQEGLDSFKAYEGRKKLTHKQKIQKIERLLESSTMTMAEFATEVINIVEDRK